MKFHTYQHIWGGYGCQLKILYGPLLELLTAVSRLTIGGQDLLNLRLNLREQVDKLDVGRENQRSRWNGTQVELGME